MKLIYIANARIPTEKANGKQIMKTCEALALRGVDVELWLPDRVLPVQLQPGDPFCFYGLKPVFAIRKLPTVDYLLRFRLWPELFQIGAYWLEELVFDFFLAKANYVGDVVYSRSLTASIIMKLFKKARVYYEIHNVSENRWAVVAHSFFWRQLDGLITISHGLQKSLAKAGLKAAVIPDAADPIDYAITKAEARRQLGFKQNLNLVVYTGSLEAKKGIATLQQAAAKFANGKLGFLLVGGSTSPQQIGNIVYTGFVLPPAVSLYLRVADILVLPNSGKTKESREYTSPMKLFEYLVAGKPIVATATPANREMLTHLENAYLVPADDPDAMAMAIQKLLSDRPLSDRLASQALADAAKYSWSSRAEKILEYINQ